MVNKKILSLVVSGTILISPSFSLEAKGMSKLSSASNIVTGFIKNHRKAIVGTTQGAILVFLAASVLYQFTKNDKKSDSEIQVSRNNKSKS